MNARIAAPPPIVLPELAPILAPVSTEKPAGELLRFESVYDEIKRLREEDDPTLPVGVWQRELKRADWPGVASLTAETLTRRSKDLQLAAWLTEAWLKTNGFSGLARGVRLMAALCAAFWDSLHPAIDDDGGIEGRVAPLNWLAADKFLYAVKCVPVTSPTGEDGIAYAWKEWEVALRQPASQTAILVSASLTPASFFLGLVRDVADATTAVDELRGILLQKMGERDAPTLSPLRTLLTDIAEFVARVLQDRPESQEVRTMETARLEIGAGRADEPLPVEAISAGGAITTRADAYARLREASDFLMRTEPHSPVPYLIRRAISWGNMSLAQLLQELLNKNADLATIYALLGIKESETKGR